MSKTVRDILRQKGDQVWWIEGEAEIYAALELMAEKNVGALVVKTRGEVVGILSERDCVRKLELQGRSPRGTPVAAIMSQRICVAAPDLSLEECMALMTEKRCRHLPVFSGNNLTGLVSIGDLVKAVIEEQQLVITQLENYIRRG